MPKTTPDQEKILTLNLNGKKGVSISKQKYDAVRDEIIAILSKQDSLAMTELSQLVKDKLDEEFEGKIGWYFMAVKLDLEARGQIERIPNQTPQTLRIKT